MKHKPVAWLATNAVGHRYLRFKKPDETHKPVPLYALEDEPPCKTGSQCVGGKCERCAVQEPVAYKVTSKLGEYCGFKSSAVKKGDLIYTAPPQREWQGLTDEETSDLIWKSDYEPRKIARAIEAKLRDKNL